MARELSDEVVFDSSFLMLVSEKAGNWEEQLASFMNYEPVLLSTIEHELRKISREKGKRARLARVSLRIAEKFRKEEVNGSPDESILDYCSSKSAFAATVDSELIRRLKQRGVRVVTFSGERLIVL